LLYYSSASYNYLALVFKISLVIMALFCSICYYYSNNPISRLG
jgi:hypothetical protein